MPPPNAVGARGLDMQRRGAGRCHAFGLGRSSRAMDRVRSGEIEGLPRYFDATVQLIQVGNYDDVDLSGY